MTRPEIGTLQRHHDDVMPRVESQRILVLDDSEADIAKLRDAFATSGFGNVDGTTDVALIEQRLTNDPPDLVVLDMGVAEPGGLAVLERLRTLHGDEACDSAPPIIVLTRHPDDRLRALEAGAQDFVGSPIDSDELVMRVRHQLELRSLRRLRDSQEQLRHKAQLSGIAELEAARLEVVERLARAGEFRDDETGEHTRRVGATAERLALAAGVDKATARAIGLAAPLHDIGKLAIPDSILLRRGRLTDDENTVMQRHTTIGAQILDGSTSRLLNLARDIALTHHERWDGNGYPSGTAERDIPLAGRIVALADVFDALTHERPYKTAWSIDQAVAEISSQAGRQFEPTLVSAFLGINHAALV